MANRLKKYLERNWHDHTRELVDAVKKHAKKSAEVMKLRQEGGANQNSQKALTKAAKHVSEVTTARDKLTVRLAWVVNKVLGRYGTKKGHDNLAAIDNGLIAKKNQAKENMQDDRPRRHGYNGKEKHLGRDDGKSEKATIETLRNHFKNLCNKRATLDLRIKAERSAAAVAEGFAPSDVRFWKLLDLETNGDPANPSAEYLRWKSLKDSVDVEALQLKLERVEVRMKSIKQNNVDDRANKWVVAGKDGHILIAAIRNWLQHTAGRLNRFLDAVGALEEDPEHPLWRGYNHSGGHVGRRRALAASQNFAVAILSILQQEVSTQPQIYGQDRSGYEAAARSLVTRERSRRTGRIFFRSSDTITVPHFLDVAKLYNMSGGPGTLKKIVALLDDGEALLGQQYAYGQYLERTENPNSGERFLRSMDLASPEGLPFDIDLVARKKRDVVRSWNAAMMKIEERVGNAWSELVSLYRQGALSANAVEDSYDDLISALGGHGYRYGFAGGSGKNDRALQYGEQALTWQQRRIFKDLIKNMRELETFLEELWNKMEDILPVLNAYQEWLRWRGLLNMAPPPLVGRLAGFTDTKSAPVYEDDVVAADIDINWTGIKRARDYFRTLRVKSGADNLFALFKSERVLVDEKAAADEAARRGEWQPSGKRKAECVQAELNEKQVQRAFDKVLGKDPVAHQDGEDYDEDEDHTDGLINLVVPPIWAFQRATVPRYHIVVSAGLDTPYTNRHELELDDDPGFGKVDHVYVSPLAAAARYSTSVVDHDAMSDARAEDLEVQGEDVSPMDYWYRCDRDGLLMMFDAIIINWRIFFEAKYGKDEDELTFEDHFLEWQMNKGKLSLGALGEEYAKGKLKEELELAADMLADLERAMLEDMNGAYSYEEWQDEDYSSVLLLVHRRMQALESEEAERRGAEFKRRGHTYGAFAIPSMTHYQAHELARRDTLNREAPRNAFGEGALLEAMEENKNIEELSLLAAKRQRSYLLRLIQERDDLKWAWANGKDGDWQWVQKRYFLQDWKKLTDRLALLNMGNLDVESRNGTNLERLDKRIANLVAYAASIRGDKGDEAEAAARKLLTAPPAAPRPEATSDGPEQGLQVPDVTFGPGQKIDLSEKELEESEWGVFNLYGGADGVDDGKRSDLENIDELEARLNSHGKVWDRYMGVTAYFDAFPSLVERKRYYKADPPNPGSVSWNEAAADMDAANVQGTGDTINPVNQRRDYTVDDVRAFRRLLPDWTIPFKSITDVESDDLRVTEMVQASSQASTINIPERASTRSINYSRMPAAYRRYPFTAPPNKYLRLCIPTRMLLTNRVTRHKGQPLPAGHRLAWYLPSGFGQGPRGKESTGVWDRLPPGIVQQSMEGDDKRIDEVIQLIANTGNPDRMLWALPLEVRRILYLNETSAMYEPTADQRPNIPTWAESKWRVPAAHAGFYEIAINNAIKLTDAGRRFWVGPGPKANLTAFAVPTGLLMDKSPAFINEFDLEWGRRMVLPFLESVGHTREEVEKVNLIHKIETKWINAKRSWLTNDAPGGGDGIQETLIDEGLVRWVPNINTGTGGRWNMAQLRAIDPTFVANLSATQPGDQLHWTTIGDGNRVLAKVKSMNLKLSIVTTFVAAREDGDSDIDEEELFGYCDDAECRLPFEQALALDREFNGEGAADGSDLDWSGWRPADVHPTFASELEANTRQRLLDSLARVERQPGKDYDHIDNMSERRFREYMKDTYDDAELVEHEVQRWLRLGSRGVSYYGVVQGLVADPDAVAPPPQQQGEAVDDWHSDGDSED